MIYLAQAYTGREIYSYKDAMLVSAQIMEKGYVLYSPIMHSHPVSNILDPKSHSFWLNQCLAILKYADIMIAYGDCSESKGAQEEIQFCKDNDINIVYWKEGVDPELLFRDIERIYESKKVESNV